MKLLRFSILCVFILFVITSLYANKLIWIEKGKYAAFTTLVHYKGYLYCAFRQANSHVNKEGNDNGEIIIIRTKNLNKWTKYSQLSVEGVDMRDPKLLVNDKNILQLMCQAVKYRKGKTLSRRTLISPVLKGYLEKRYDSIRIDASYHNNWIWDATWIDNKVYGFSYIPDFRLLYSYNGIDFVSSSAEQLEGHPTEASIERLNEHQLITVVRVNNQNSIIGIVEKNNTVIQWIKTPYRLEAPKLLNIEGDIYVAGRNVANNTKCTSLFKYDQLTHSLQHLLDLADSGDCSYPGMAVWKNRILISHYKADKDGTSGIYLSTITRELTY